MMTNRPKVQKVLAHHGYGSRRQIEQWIKEGLIKVNGSICELGQRVSNRDRIVVNGKPIKLENAPSKQQAKLLLYHKKAGEICTRAQTEHPSVFDTLPEVEGRWVSIGRLDLNSSGLLVFTNDGQIAHQWMHPSFDVKRTYHVRVFGKVLPSHCKQFLKGIRIEGDWLQCEQIKPIGKQNQQAINQWFEVVLKQGKYREIRRLFGHFGLEVSRLVRVQYGPFTLPKNLRPGQFCFVEKPLSKRTV